MTQLEDRLNVKKEELLEKELVLEEVGSLSERLRFQAVEGREETLDIAKTVNEFQARIKKVTRRLMACVSELSMYQVSMSPFVCMCLLHVTGIFGSGCCCCSFALLAVGLLFIPFFY